MSAPDRINLSTGVANKLRKARERADLSQSALAKKAGVPRARIKRIECHELETVKTEEYESILVALGLSTKSASRARTRAAKAEAKSGARKATKSGERLSDKLSRKMRVRTARAVLEEHGLLDVTLGELLKG
jgi:DNA-binding XRE family transcriptional regulator